MYKFIILIFIFSIVFNYQLIIGKNKKLSFSKNELTFFKKLLIKNFDKKFIAKLIKNKKFKKITGLTIQNIATRGIGSNYSHFTDKYSINLAKKFKKKNKKILNSVSKKYKLDKNLIVAILLVESAFGKYKPNYIVFNVYATLLIELRESMRNNYIPKILKAFPKMTKKEAKERLINKYNWAHNELLSLIKILKKENLPSIFHIKGSFAGAIGLPQFLPSSFLNWGVDGNKDGKIRLYNKTDAIHSIANYFKNHGWINSLPEKDKLNIILEYNNSTDYASVIIKIIKMI
jgi:membrane-bound lytic murein transglycosylase B